MQSSSDTLDNNYFWGSETSNDQLQESQFSSTKHAQLTLSIVEAMPDAGINNFNTGR